MKKMSLIVLIVIIALIVAVVAIGVIAVTSSQRQFYDDGYVLLTDEIGKINFTSGKSYSEYMTGTVSFKDSDGTKQTISSTNYMHMEDGGIVALSDGVLLDLSDLASGSINNYYVANRLTIKDSGIYYETETTSGVVTLDEHVWKLSENRYLIRAQEIYVHFSSTDIRTVSDYLEVYINNDGVIYFLLENDMWSTVSSSCYIETSSGATINPVTQVISSGGNKITLADLVLDKDEMIVLADDQMRTQIIPIFDITTVDGQDGASGSSGGSGVDGDEGDSGANGSQGASGSAGMDAVSSSSVMTAIPTMSFSNWTVSQTNVYGEITIYDEDDKLNVDSTSYPGRIYIVNVATGEEIDCWESTTLGGTQANDEFNFYTASISETGGTYFVMPDGEELEPNTQYRIVVESYYIINEVVYYRIFNERYFYTDSSGVQLSYTYGTAEYDSDDDEYYSSFKMNLSIDDTNYSKLDEIYLYLFEEDESTNLTFSSIDSASWKEKIRIVIGDITTTTTVYRDGSVSSDSDETTTFASAQDMEITFSELVPDGNYVVRVVMYTNDSSGTLSDQTLNVTTVVPGLTGTSNNIVSAYYNRTIGGYEVYRPTVVDTYGKIEKYEYVAYDSNGEKVAYKILYPGESEPAIFYLGTSDYYQFGVYAYYNDNEKTIIYSLSDSLSTEVYVTGYNMPQVLSGTGIYQMNVRYNTLEDSKIGFYLDGTSSIIVDSSHPLSIELYGDYLTDGRVYTIKNEELNNLSYTGSVIGSSEETEAAATIDFDQPAEGTDVASLTMSFYNLYNNTNYSLSVYGYINLGDGNGWQYRKIGTVSFTTDSINAASVSVNSVSSTSDLASDDSLGMMMKVSIMNDEEITYTDEDTNQTVVTNYTQSQMEQGQISLLLYKGTSYDKVLVGSTTIDESDVDSDGNSALGQIYDPTGEGYYISEDDFGVVAITGESYTLVVDQLADQSYQSKYGLEYVNEITQISGYTKVLVASSTLPSLTTSPEDGVTVAAITNENAEKYGAVVDEDLPSDTVIGYTITANYDNTESNAAQITYYGFEYLEFYMALDSSADPIKDAEKIFQTTVSVASDATTVPGIAVFFKGTDFSIDVIPGETVLSNYYIYEAAVDDFTRGYKYTFAYTVEAVAALSGAIYPYDSADYNQYKVAYGAGIEGSSYIGQGVAYVLHSGIIDAPKIEPTVNSFVYEINQEDLTTYTYTGTVDVYYSFNDTDGCIVTNSLTPTSIEYEDYDGSTLTVQAATSDSLVASVGPTGDQIQWYSIKLPFSVNRQTAYYASAPSIIGEKILSPTITIERYNISYDDLMSLLDSSYEKESVYLTRIPVEYNYEGYFEDTSYTDNLQLNINVNEDKNLIEFAVTSGSMPASDLGTRAYVLKVMFTASENQVDDDGNKITLGYTVDPITYYLPLTYGQDATVSTNVSTAILEAYPGVEFDITASVMYDNGDQGWGLVYDTEGNADILTSNTAEEDVNYFALQRVDISGTDDEEFILDSYYARNTGLSGSSMSAMLTMSSSTSDALKTLEGLMETAILNDSDYQDGIKGVFNYAYYVASDSANSTLSRFFATNSFGISDYYYSSVTSKATTVIVPKGVGEVEFDIDTMIYQPDDNGNYTINNNTISVDKFVPSVQSIETTTSTNSVTVDSLVLAGTTADSSVYAYIFNTSSEAQYWDYYTPVATRTLSLTGNSLTSTDGVTITGLNEGVTYYIAIVGIPDGETEKQLLLDSTTGGYAIYSFDTYSGIIIKNMSENLDLYNNYTYELKDITFKFSLNQYLQTEVKYEVYDSTGENLLLSYADLLAYGFTPPTLSTYNTFYLNLMPTINKIMSDENGIIYQTDAETGEYLTDENGLYIPEMRYFEPGETYVIKLTSFNAGSIDSYVTIYETDETGAEVAKEVLLSEVAGDPTGISNGEGLSVSVTLTEAAEINSLIYVNSASADTITFGTSLTDTEYSIMMKFGTEETAINGSLYTVRFTDIDGNLIIDNDSMTAYHNQVYKVGEISTFALSGLEASTQYVLNIYAAVDYEHDGISYPTKVDDVISSDTYGQIIQSSYMTYEELFNTSSADLETFGHVVVKDAPYPNFLALINSFWDSTTGKNISIMDSIEQFYLISSRTQSTTPESGVYFDQDNISIAVTNMSSFDLILFESAGIIRDKVNDDGTVSYSWQYFRTVEYSIEGYDSTGTPFSYSGMSSADNPTDTMFTQGNYLGFISTYTYSIPYNIKANSKYVITIVLTDEDGVQYTIYHTYLS